MDISDGIKLPAFSTGDLDLPTEVVPSWNFQLIQASATVSGSCFIAR